MSGTLSYGLNSGGFVRMRLPEIRRAIFDQFTEITGVSLDESPDSFVGILVGIFSEREAAMWELSEQSYLSAFPVSAPDGTPLDLAVSFAGVKRLQSRRSAVRALFYGTQGTVIDAGAVVTATEAPAGYDRPPRFVLFSQVTISSLSAGLIWLGVPAIVPGTTYWVDVNGIRSQYSAGGTETPAQIATILAAAVQAAADSNTVAVAYNATLQIASSGTIAVNYSTSLNLIDLGSPGILAAEDNGPVPGDANTLTKIVTPVPGWTSVSNPLAASKGQLRESDAQLRARYRMGVYRLGANTINSIRANLIQDISGLSSVSVYENITDSADAEGRPAHSIEIVAEGGDPQQIAERIFALKGAGIATYGNTPRGVYDDTGYLHTIYFSRPAPRLIWIKGTIVTTSEEVVPGNVIARAAAAISAAGNELEVGEDVFLQRLSAAVFSATTGVARINLTAAVTNIGDPAPAPGAYSSLDIAIGARQRASFSSSRISLS